MSIYIVFISAGVGANGELVGVQETSKHGTFDEATDACVDSWDTNDAIHPDIFSWVKSTKDDTKYWPEDYCKTHGQCARDLADFRHMSYGTSA